MAAHSRVGRASLTTTPFRTASKRRSARSAAGNGSAYTARAARTRGVHALAQVAHADVPVSASHAPERWVLALNAHLPPQIRVQGARFVSDAFHARFTTTGKVYRYRLWNAPRVAALRAGPRLAFPAGRWTWNPCNAAPRCSWGDTISRGLRRAAQDRRKTRCVPFAMSASGVVVRS